MLTEEYSIHLEQFHGPLDLLLHLIRRAEIDINEVSIARITEQYLQHLEKLQQIDVEPAGEFLVTAATLVEIKSRMLVPPDDEEGGLEAAAALVEKDSGNPAAELVRALLQYKRFRETAEKLESGRAQWLKRYPTKPLIVPDAPLDPEELDKPLDLDDIGLFDLVQAYAAVAQAVVFERLGSHNVVDDDTPIELHAADIMDRLRARAMDAGAEAPAPRPAMSLRSIFSGRKRVEVIGLFLAVLELVRQRAVRVIHKPEDKDVTLTLAEAGDESPEDRASPPGITPASDSGSSRGNSEQSSV